MKRFFWVFAALALTVNISALNVYASDETPESLFANGQKAYNSSQYQQAIEFFNKAVKAKPDFANAYFNLGAIEFNLQHYNEALAAFKKVLEIDSNDYATRYESARVYEKLGRTDEAIAAFEMIPANSSRYQSAQENLDRLRSIQDHTGPKVATTTTSTTDSKVDTTDKSTGLTSSKETPQSKQSETLSSDNENTKGGKVSVNPESQIASNSEIPTAGISSLRRGIPQEFVSGFSGPTGIVMDGQGNLFVANFSKNTIYKVSANGEKKLLVSGNGINGPVGMTMDHKSGDLYVANHLDNSIIRVSQTGKVSVVATGLNKPYNIFLDEGKQTLYVSEQETNSIARIKLN